MKKNITYFMLFLCALFFSCNHLDDFVGGDDGDSEAPNGRIDFKHSATLKVGGDGAAEIAAFDPATNRLFVVNVEAVEISVFDISDIGAPKRIGALPAQDHTGNPNSVSVHDGKVAVAYEAPVKQDPGYIKLFSAHTLEFIKGYTVGALPDMVTFSPNGNYLVAACEGEPNDAYTIDPKGSVAIIDVASDEVWNLEFDAFNAEEARLAEDGFRVFGPNADLAKDVEPEYVAISDDSNRAWVTLQENNGVAVVDLQQKTIEAIAPLGFKDYGLPGNEIDPSNRDDKLALRRVPVYGMYQPDAIAYYNVNGMDYVVTANEGDARDYDGYSEEERMADLVFDTNTFPNADSLQLDANLGRLQSTTTLGDIDGDGDFDQLYNYGARSFTIWSGAGQRVYDSGNDIALKTLELTPDAFNGGLENPDSRSDDKGAEPETVVIKEIEGKHILFVGLERNNQIMVYDISNPSFPRFLQILSATGDIGPEGLIVIGAEESPTGKDLLIVSNEVSGTISFYSN